MGHLSNPGTSEHDEHFLRRSFDVARRAITHGNHPFGAILVDENRNVLIETENGYMPAHDGTGHAERLRAVTGNHPENPTLDLPCRKVFETGQRATNVVGPMLEDEAESLHAGVW